MTRILYCGGRDLINPEILFYRPVLGRSDNNRKYCTGDWTRNERSDLNIWHLFLYPTENQRFGLSRENPLPENRNLWAAHPKVVRLVGQFPDFC
jgi:hypothetical protein